MPNHWRNQSDFKIPPIIGIIILGIIAMIVFPKLFANTSVFTNSDSTLSSSDSNINANLPNNPNTSNPNDPNTSPENLNPLLPNVNNNLAIGKGNNEIATGYWILFVNNGTIQQIPINTQDYSFLQELVNSDRNGTPANQIFLVENGQIQRYIVSSEVSSVITNLASIYSRSTVSQSKQTNPAPTSPDTITPKSSPTPNSSSPSNPSSNTTTPPNSSAPSTPSSSSAPGSTDSGESN